MLRSWIGRFLQRCFVHDLPADLTYCEVGCRRSDCTLANFATCSLRDSKAPPLAAAYSPRVVPLRAVRRAAPGAPALAAAAGPAHVASLRDHPRFRVRLPLQRFL